MIYVTVHSDKPGEGKTELLKAIVASLPSRYVVTAPDYLIHPNKTPASVIEPRKVKIIEV